VLTTERIRPLHDVWLRPRRVFRELSARPIGAVDYLLGAAQGIAGWLALSRAQNAGAGGSIAEIFAKALLLGSPAGVASLMFMGAIYARLGAHNGKPFARNQLIHVLAYSGVPMAASLLVWLLTALVAGEATFQQVSRADTESFVALLLHAQFLASVLLTIWSVVIQVMGLSEIQGIVIRRALGLWALGQMIGYLAMLFVLIVLATLLPNAIPR
jgi:hypothetical protein